MSTAVSSSGSLAVRWPPSAGGIAAAIDIRRRLPRSGVGSSRAAERGSRAICRVRLELRLLRRQPDDERRALAFDALDGDRAAVELDELLDQREADPDALARPRAVDLIEAVEDVRQPIRGDADAGVGDHDLGPRAAAVLAGSGRERDRRRFRRVA